jgi:hypothetical protein
MFTTKFEVTFSENSGRAAATLHMNNSFTAQFYKHAFEIAKEIVFET